MRRGAQTAFLRTQAQLARAMVCPTCGKRLTVANLAGRGFTPEKITRETHCTCAGGPAHTLPELKS